MKGEWNELTSCTIELKSDWTEMTGGRIERKKKIVMTEEMD